jgi:hypothetical protein
MKKKREQFTEASWAANVRMMRSEIFSKVSSPVNCSQKFFNGRSAVQASTYARGNEWGSDQWAFRGFAFANYKSFLFIYLFIIYLCFLFSEDNYPSYSRYKLHVIQVVLRLKEINSFDLILLFFLSFFFLRRN